MADTTDVNAVVTVESGGRTLSGAGVSAEQLQSTIDQHEERTAPAEKSVDSPVSSGSATSAGEPPKQTRGQARFSELTSARKAAEEKAEAAERKAAELEARLAQQSRPEQPRQEPAQSQPAATPQQPVQSTRAKPSEDDIGTKYETYASFVEDLSDWKAEQRLAQLDFQGQIRQHLEQERTRQTFDTHVEATRAKGRAVYGKEFDDLLANGPGTFVNMPMAAVRAILEHPKSEHVQRVIMASAEIANKLAQLAFNNPYGFGIELEKLVPAPTPSNGVRQVTPPPPMVPVGSGSRSSVPSSAEHAERGDYAAYKAARAAERRGNR